MGTYKRCSFFIVPDIPLNIINNISKGKYCEFWCFLDVTYTYLQYEALNLDE